MNEQLTVEQEALHLGWIPKEEFKGDPEKWTDAETFVRRGKELLPILRKNNETLQGQVGRLEGQLAETRQIIAQHTEEMEAMKDLQKKAVKDAVQRAREELRASLRTAKESGDLDAEVEITEQLGEVNRQLKDLDNVPTVKAPPETKTPPPDPDTLAWISRNPWFESDAALQGLTMGLAQKIKSSQATSGLTGKAFYDKLDEMLVEYLPSRRQAPSKVEGGRGSGGGSGGGSEKSFSSLPTDAKAECEKESKRFVGEGKAFKTKAEWQAHFAELYWAGE